MTSPSYPSSADSSVSTPIARPPRLEPGDHVGIVAPSGPVDRNRLMAGIRILEEFQLRPVFSESLFQQNSYLAGTDHERAEALNQYFKNPDIRAIICARGGVWRHADAALFGFRMHSPKPQNFGWVQ